MRQVSSYTTRTSHLNVTTAQHIETARKLAQTTVNCHNCKRFIPKLADTCPVCGQRQ